MKACHCVSTFGYRHFSVFCFTYVWTRNNPATSQARVLYHAKARFFLARLTIQLILSSSIAENYKLLRLCINMFSNSWDLNALWEILTTARSWGQKSVSVVGCGTHAVIRLGTIANASKSFYLNVIQYNVVVSKRSYNSALRTEEHIRFLDDIKHRPWANL